VRGIHDAAKWGNRVQPAGDRTAPLILS
jgi:hypothetical protein